MATLKNVSHQVIKFTRKYIGFYDFLFISFLLVGFLTPDPVDSFFFGVAIYGAINAVVKNARPELTIITTNRDTEIVD